MDDVVNALLDAFADKVVERLQTPHKDLWSAADLSARYGVSETCIRRKMTAGEFGELVQINARTRMVPWSGVQAYEAAHRGSIERTQPQRKTRHTHRADPGPI